MAYRPGTAFGNKSLQSDANDYLKGIGTNHKRDLERIASTSKGVQQQRSKLSNLHDWRVEVQRPQGTATPTPQDLVR